MEVFKICFNSRVVHPSEMPLAVPYGGIDCYLGQRTPDGRLLLLQEVVEADGEDFVGVIFHEFMPTEYQPCDYEILQKVTFTDEYRHINYDRWVWKKDEPGIPSNQNLKKKPKLSGKSAQV